jgi:uncharacterized iron-regulated membrane protein
MGAAVNTRKALRWLHRWLGLLGGSFFVLLGLTGSVLVYEPELQRWLRPAFHAPLADVEASRPTISYEAVFTQAKAALPPMASALLSVPEDPRRPLRLSWVPDDGREIYREASLHPLSGAVLAQDDPEAFDAAAVIGLVWDLHVYLLAGQWGLWAVGALGFALMIAACSGLWLSWPRNGNWRVVLRWKRGASPIRRQFDQHRTAGLYPWVILLILGFSGSYLVFPSVYHAATRPLGSVPAFPQGLASTPTPGAVPLTLDQAAEIALREYPEGRITFINPAFTPEDFIRVRLKQPDEWLVRGQTRLWLDRYSGEILTRTDPSAGSALTRFYGVQLPLHAGTALGEVTRVLWFAAGFVPLWLMISGVRLWLFGRRADRRRPQRAQSAGLTTTEA